MYLHAAKAEVWGLTITEAMACGIPVVASAVGGIVDQVFDGENGFLVPAGDANTMADRVVRLLTDHALLRKMGETAARVVRERFSVDRQVQAYAEWYKEIITANEN